jgi:hypothetical protein
MQRRTTVSVLYFSLASLWGFMAGACGILGSLVMIGRPFQPTLFAGIAIAACAALAIGGGAVTQAAYRQTRTRRSR